MIFRRVKTPESTVWPVNEMALKDIASPVISSHTNHEIRAGFSDAQWDMTLSSSFRM